ncbi:ABC transporter ATP-binding protein [Corynebacterium camporealensis]
MKPVVAVEQLHFAYGKNSVLKGVDLNIDQGEIVCLLGPNGVGKTTLIENLFGSLKPNEGSIRVLGEDPMSASNDFWAKVSLVQQNWADHKKWTVRDQLEWIRATYATQTDDVLSIDEALDLVGLPEKAKSKMSRLSGGQRRSIDFAAALLPNPQLLVLDEPTTGLDPRSKARIHDRISMLQDKQTTVLMTTHDLAEAEKIADRVVIMDNGRIVANGTPRQLRSEYDHGAEVSWTQDGQAFVHSTESPEAFLQTLDLNSISNLTVTRSSLEDAYLQIVQKFAQKEEEAA